jgi:hypothetical protein
MSQNSEKIFTESEKKALVENAKYLRELADEAYERADTAQQEFDDILFETAQPVTSDTKQYRENIIEKLMLELEEANKKATDAEAKAGIANPNERLGLPSFRRHLEKPKNQGVVLTSLHREENPKNVTTGVEALGLKSFRTKTKASKTPLVENERNLDEEYLDEEYNLLPNPQESFRRQTPKNQGVTLTSLRRPKNEEQGQGQGQGQGVAEALGLKSFRSIKKESSTSEIPSEMPVSSIHPIDLSSTSEIPSEMPETQPVNLSQSTQSRRNSMKEVNRLEREAARGARGARRAAGEEGVKAPISMSIAQQRRAFVDDRESMAAAAQAQAEAAAAAAAAKPGSFSFSRFFGFGKGGKNTHHHRKKSKSALSRKNIKRYSVKAKRRNRRKSRR